MILEGMMRRRKSERPAVRLNAASRIEEAAELDVAWKRSQERLDRLLRSGYDLSKVDRLWRAQQRLEGRRIPIELFLDELAALPPRQC
jgi:hypothetical protein